MTAPVAVSPPYALPAPEKRASLLAQFNDLVEWHAERCEPYRRLLAALPAVARPAADLREIPYLPAQLFKLVDLASVAESQVLRVLASSGTSGQRVSRVFLDQDTSSAQARALAAIARSFLGSKRLPMIVLDTERIIRDPGLMNARGAGIAGFWNLGRDILFALDDTLSVRSEAVAEYLAKHAGDPVMVFGLTAFIWQHLAEAEAEGLSGLDLSQAIVVHGGGWKKLADKAVDDRTFKRRLNERFGISAVHNYYGMVEQTGSVFMECEKGALHASDYSDVLVRHERTLEVLDHGQTGLLQVMSTLPRSYPGHCVLTEDLGQITGEDDCACGRLGKTIRVQGRLPASEARGCSDTTAAARIGP